MGYKSYAERYQDDNGIFKNAVIVLAKQGLVRNRPTIRPTEIKKALTLL